MTQFNSVTGHIESPRRNWGEGDSREHEYTVDCDGRVTYRVIACDAWTAERKARALYRAECGQYPDRVTARW